MGTVGGNLAGGDPLTDPGASLIALDAEVTLSSSKGQRRLTLGRVFHRLLSNRSGAGRIADRDPCPATAKTGWSHIKFTPRSVEDFATVGVAITLQAKNGTCEDVRLGLNSVASTIVRAKKAEEVLRGKSINDATLREMGEVAATEVRSHGRQPRLGRIQARDGQSLSPPRRRRGTGNDRKCPFRFGLNAQSIPATPAFFARRF